MDRRPSSRGVSITIARQSMVSSVSATGPLPQDTAAVGSAAPRSATSTIQATHQPAATPTSRPAPGHTSVSSPPVSPSTVAGPTAGAASRLAATATRLT